MNRVIVATQAVALFLAAHVAPVAGQTVLVDATVSLPPVEARVVLGSDHGRVRIPDARRPTPLANARMRDALRRAERNFLRDMRRAKRNLHERLERADRKFPQSHHCRFPTCSIWRKHRLKIPKISAKKNRQPTNHPQRSQTCLRKHPPQMPVQPLDQHWTK